ERFHQEHVGRHKYQFTLLAVKEVQLVELLPEPELGETGLLGHFAQGGLLERFALFDVALGDGPAAETVLDHQDFDFTIALATPEHSSTGRVFTRSADALGSVILLVCPVWPALLLLVHRNHCYGKWFRARR